jgi:hypothetical protein
MPGTGEYVSIAIDVHILGKDKAGTQKIRTYCLLCPGDWITAVIYPEHDCIIIKCCSYNVNEAITVNILRMN